MISKEKIVEIIREETWVEVDSSRVYGIEEAAEKVLKIIEAAQQSVQSDVALTCQACTEKPATVHHCNDCYFGNEPSRKRKQLSRINKV